MFTNKLKNKWLKLTVKLSLIPGFIMSLPNRVLADPPTNPWAGGQAVTPDTLESTTGQHMSKDLAYGLIAGGVILLAAAVGVLVSLLNHDAEDKKNDGAFKTIMQIVILILCVVIGIVLIGLGFTGIKALNGNQ